MMGDCDDDDDDDGDDDDIDDKMMMMTMQVRTWLSHFSSRLPLHLKRVKS